VGYPIQLKEAVLKRVLQENKLHYEVAIELGAGQSTIGKWEVQTEVWLNPDKSEKQKLIDNAA